eukprot:6173418-Pleurochrysis_carterae.AAC.1
MDLQNSQFDDHDRVVVNANRVEKVHSVLRLRGAADHSLTRGGCTAELHVYALSPGEAIAVT